MDGFGSTAASACPVIGGSRAEILLPIILSHYVGCSTVLGIPLIVSI